MKKSSPTLNLTRHLQSLHRQAQPLRIRKPGLYDRVLCDRSRLSIQRPTTTNQPWFLRFLCTKCGWTHQDDRPPQELVAT